MKKLLLVFMVFVLASSAYAMCPKMAGCSDEQRCKRMTECEYRNECPKEVNGAHLWGNMYKSSATHMGDLNDYFSQNTS